MGHDSEEVANDCASHGDPVPSAKVNILAIGRPDPRRLNGWHERGRIDHVSATSPPNSVSRHIWRYPIIKHRVEVRRIAHQLRVAPLNCLLASIADGERKTPFY